MPKAFFKIGIHVTCSYLSEIEVELADLKVLPKATLLLIPAGLPASPIIRYQVQHLLNIFLRCCFCVLPTQKITIKPLIIVIHSDFSQTKPHT
jgi:hypothetical protein